ncbi:MAG: MarR family transcriptional regulator [Hyphomicrobiales bacterium]|nr:MarR family transcriptional regulator [Hyphomicrobiales bacterium]
MSLDPEIAIYSMPGHLIRRLNQVAVSLFHDECARAGHDLTPVQYAALKAVQKHPGIDQVSLAGAIAYDRTTIGGVVARLEEKGLVTRAPAPEDRRVRRIAITPAGVALVGAIDPIVARIQDLMLDGLDAEEKALFVRLAAKAAAAGNDRSRAPLKPYAPR